MNRTVSGAIAVLLRCSRRALRRCHIGALVVGFSTITGLLMMTGCADNTRNGASAPSPRPGNFPVVEPFALDEAGSRVSVTFELPDARDNGILRPVFVGFRAINTSAETDAALREAMKVTDYLHETPIPVRLKLWRIDDAEPKPVVLSDGHWDMQNKRAWWEPHPEKVFTLHPAGSTDNRPLIDSGLYDLDEVYYIHEFARIVPPTPGRYRLEVENLESHPMLQQQKQLLTLLRYELLVSHYQQRGIE
ncbi:hypothetical protein [Luteimonas sp. 3794]|uniref:hypothetical protein n=1 Tax=Luteimonas sp. 3794 TaxID=2817730 RepID=UPI002862D07A|nr:hypothetical protein [Luteimonas sp. 3794]MDR6990681.1 hypothetical protein [Luteimonas sp. 3794]